uniref:Glutamine amidotransferase n=3 Tax=unclassified bacterial viruses TaxID=12333 RepID=A0AAU6W0G0_9VIRU
MCGIVGVASNGPMTLQMKEFFQSLLFHDVVRGHHATGVAAIDTIDRSLTVEKKAVASPDFLDLKEPMDNLFNHKHNFNIYIGHNRWATSGAKDDDNNAHPFIHGDIVGVHNGSLRNQSLLDDHKNFVVDSDNLFYQLNKTGLHDTMSKTDGAFALVWYDKKDNSLNFIRNDERPLCVAKLSNGCWVWASERGMLTWLINRHKTLMLDTETDATDNTIKTPMIYNLEKGLHMSIPFKDKARQMDRLGIRKLVLPSFERTYTSGYDSNYTSRFSTQSSRGGYRQGSQERSPYQKERDEIISKHLMNGNCDSSMELVFLGHIHPVTQAGYKQDISIYEHRNVWGQTIICHAYNHAGNLTSKWTDADIGKKLYAKIMNLTTPISTTHDELKNEVLKDYSVSVHQMSLSKPGTAFYGYTDEGFEIVVEEEKSEAATINTAVVEKEDANGNVIPFPQSDASKTSSSKVDEGSASGMGESITIANDVLSRSRIVEYLNKNAHKCANCGGSLRVVPLSKAYLIEHYDREAGQTTPYLMCDALCHEAMEEWVESIDKEYDKLLGNIAND